MIKPQTYHICRRREIPREGSEGGGKKNRLGEKKERERERERRSLPDRVSKCTREKRTDENVCV